MVRRVRAARRVVQQERHIRIDVVELIHPVDGVIRHRGGQVPLRIPDERLDMRGIPEQRARRPLVGVAAHETVEVLEPHAGRPLVERTRLARLIDRRVVILSEPRRAVAVLQENATNRGAILADHAVVTGEARRDLRDHTEPDRVVVAPGDQCSPGRRAQRGRVEIGVAQPAGGDAVQRRRRNDAAECGWCTKADVVGEDQQDVRRALWRDHARRPGRFRLGSVEVDLSLKFLRRRREVAAVDRSSGVGRTGLARDLLCHHQRGCGDSAEDYRSESGESTDRLHLSSFQPISKSHSRMVKGLDGILAYPSD